MFKLIILMSCFIGIAFSKCIGEGGGCGGSSGSVSSCNGDSCGSNSGSISSCSGGGCGRGLSGHSVNINDFSDYDYDIISLPDGVGTIGIMDSPFYDCKTKSLYFIDLFKQNIYRYSEHDNRIYYCSIPGYATPSFFIPVRGKPGRHVMGQNQTVYEVQWDGYSTVCKVVGTVFKTPEDSTHNTNWAAAGPKGALYVGFFGNKLCGGPANAGLYRWQKKRGLQKLPGSYKTCNSMVFDNKRNIFYVMDGCEQTIRAFKVNKKTGKLSKPWIVISNFGLPNTVAPVGLNVDRDGNLVTGVYKGGLAVFINSRTGEIMKTVKMPTKFTAAVAYGGCDFSKLFVLTAQLDADILTGTPTNNTVGEPAGSLMVFHGLGTGQGQLRKPCIGC